MCGFQGNKFVVVVKDYQTRESTLLSLKRGDIIKMMDPEIDMKQGENRPCPTGPPAVEKGPPATEKGPPAVEKGPPAAEKGPPAVEKGPPAVEKGPPAAEKGPPATEKGCRFRCLVEKVNLSSFFYGITV